MRPIKIMLIDDNSIDLFLHEELLKSDKITSDIISFSGGKSALDFLSMRQKSPDQLPNLILLDIQMPIMNGFEFIIEFEKLSETVRNTCNIVMVSSTLHPSDLTRAASNPSVIKLIHKPLETKEIIEVIQDLGL